MYEDNTEGANFMNEQVKLIGQRIQDLREISELSVEEVAESLNISVDKYISYENGENQVCRQLIRRQKFPFLFS